MSIGEELDHLHRNLQAQLQGLAILLDELSARVARIEEQRPPPPPPPPDPEPRTYMWLSPEEIRALPDSGDAWDLVLSWANREITPLLCDQENQAEAVVVAAAVAYIKTGDTAYHDKALSYIEQAMGTEVGSSCDRGGKLLAVGRNLAGYLVAAELLDYRPQTLIDWLRGVAENPEIPGLIYRPLWETTGNQSLVEGAIGPLAWPQNHGTAYRLALLAAAHFLEDTVLVDAVAQKYYDWLGRSGEGFKWDAQEHEQVWHASYPDTSGYRGVNPAGSQIVIDGVARDVDGCTPEDMKRGGGLCYPFFRQNYVVEGWAYALATAHMLDRLGYDVFEWEDRAIERAFTWLHEPYFEPHPARLDQPWEHAFLPQDEGDKEHNWFINGVFGTGYPVEMGGPGKCGLGFWAWIYG